MDTILLVEGFKWIAGICLSQETMPELILWFAIGFGSFYDQKPRRRLRELMKSHGMPENQQVIFLSDGGEDLR